MELAGMGRCSGEWWNADCPKFGTYEAGMNNMKHQCNKCKDTGVTLAITRRGFYPMPLEFHCDCEKGKKRKVVWQKKWDKKCREGKE